MNKLRKKRTPREMATRRLTLPSWKINLIISAKTSMIWKQIVIKWNKRRLRNFRGQNTEQGAILMPSELQWGPPATAWTSSAEETSQGQKTTVTKWRKKTHCRPIYRRLWSSTRRSRTAWRVQLLPLAGNFRQLHTTERCRRVQNKTEVQMPRAWRIRNQMMPEDQSECSASLCRIPMSISRIWRSRT